MVQDQDYNCKPYFKHSIAKRVHVLKMEWCETVPARGLHAASALEGLGPRVLRVAIGRLVGLRLPGVPSALVVAVRRPRGGGRRVLGQRRRKRGSARLPRGLLPLGLG